MAEKLEVVYVPAAEIKPYEKNPRKNDQAIKQVAKSIRQYGFKNPILLDKRGVIIAGHTRYYAAVKELGMKTLPVIYARDLSKEQVKALRIADNKVAEYSDWDDELLRGEMSWLQDAGFDLADVGFNEIELMELMDDIVPDKFGKEEYGEYEKEASKSLKSFNVIICCFSEKEKRYIQRLLGETGKLKRTYPAQDIRVMRKAREE